MSDLIDDPIVGENSPEFSVTELSGAIKRVIEGEFSHVRIRAEVGRVSLPRSGHVYLDLKDDKSVIAAVMWKGVAARLSVMPEEGMEVVATGRITTFGGQSKYQIVLEDIKPAGVGALMAMLDKRKKMLAAEGLFDVARKRPLPYLPEVIGVITSPSGAVIRDILHRLRDRFPRKVLIWPVVVQGDKCAGEVARAIDGFNAFTPGGALPRPDLLIVARGGGSLEDLWGFNEEIVARAAAMSDIPLISAVGHETDTTLIDFVSDKRAPTPTAAAELAVPVRLELLSWVDAQSARMSHALTTSIGNRGQRLRDISRALPRSDTLLDGPRQRLDAVSDRLPAALIRGVQTRHVRLSQIAGPLRISLLRRLVDGDRRKLSATSARLNLSTLDRDIRQKHESFQSLSKRFTDVANRQNADRRAKMDGLNRLRETLGYKATLGRGYAVVRGENGVLTTKKAAAKAGGLEIEFADGRLVVGEGTGAKPARKPAKPTKAPNDPSDQGSLF